MADEIRHTAEFQRRTKAGSQEVHVGSLLTMTDGSQWLHPYSGRAPFQLKGPDR